MKKIIPVILTLILIAIAGYLFFNKKNEQTNAGGGSLILYYGDTCPHCKIVDEHIEKNNIDKKLKITRKEIFNNKANNAELGEKAVNCGLAIDAIGVPFLWDSGQCIMGDQPIIEYLNNK